MSLFLLLALSYKFHCLPRKNAFNAGHLNKGINIKNCFSAIINITSDRLSHNGVQPNFLKYSEIQDFLETLHRFTLIYDLCDLTNRQFSKSVT